MRVKNVTELLDITALSDDWVDNNSAPDNVVPPSTSGVERIGNTVSCSTGVWAGSPTFSLQWQRDAGSGFVNVGTTGASYTIVVGDHGVRLRCVVTATNANGVASKNSNTIGPVIDVIPVNTVAPAVTGTASLGGVLSTTNGTWTSLNTPVYTYRWQRNGNNIDGAQAVASTYTVVTADIGHPISCHVTATNDGGPAAADSNSVTPT